MPETTFCRSAYFSRTAIRTDAHTNRGATVRAARFHPTAAVIVPVDSDSSATELEKLSPAAPRAATDKSHAVANIKPITSCHGSKITF